MVAFAGSSVKEEDVAQWLSFASGCMITASLVMSLFAGYSAKASRARTEELNTILEMARITPMPQIAHESTDNGGDANEPSSVRVSIDAIRDSIRELDFDFKKEIHRRDPVQP